MPTYDVDYFIKKFEAIPPERWTVGAYSRDGKCCALGHCGVITGRFGEIRHTEEAVALFNLFQSFGESISHVNDYSLEAPPKNMDGGAARKRVLDALKKIKAGGWLT